MRSIIQFTSPNSYCNNEYVDENGNLTKYKRCAIKLPINIADACVLEWNRQLKELNDNDSEKYITIDV